MKMMKMMVNDERYDTLTHSRKTHTHTHTHTERERERESLDTLRSELVRGERKRRISYHTVVTFLEPPVKTM